MQRNGENLSKATFDQLDFEEEAHSQLLRLLATLGLQASITVAMLAMSLKGDV